jgi:hypothetical protein
MVSSWVNKEQGAPPKKRSAELPLFASSRQTKASTIFDSRFVPELGVHALVEQATGWQ